MGVLSVLGKIGAGIAAPFTGGASLAAIPAIDALGNVLGGGAAAAKGGRLDEAALQGQLTDRNNRALYDAAAFNVGAPAARTNQIVRGDAIGRMQDSPLTGDPRIDRFSGGGLRPSLMGEGSRQGGDALMRQALQALLSGSDRITPQMSGIPESGFMEKLGGIGGTVGGILGALGGLGRKPQVAGTPPLQAPLSANVRVPRF